MASASGMYIFIINFFRSAYVLFSFNCAFGSDISFLIDDRSWLVPFHNLYPIFMYICVYI